MNTPVSETLAVDRAGVLRATAIRKDFFSHLAVDDVTLTIEKGDVVSIVGPSGAGKSTFLRCLNLLETPESGTIRVGDLALEFGPGCPPIRRADLLALRRQVGMVFQNFNLFPHLSVLKNVALPQVKTLGMGKGEATERARELLERVGLGKKLDDYPWQCSGGQQQRIAIARVLALDPSIILFDEPTSALDAEVGAEILDIMKQLAESGTTMIVVTHEMSFARRVADRMLLMVDGRVIADGPPDTVIENPVTERAQQFFGAVLGR